MDLENQKAQYDSSAKQILAQKKILAYILKRSVPEFEKASLDDIAYKYIEGEPLISMVPVDKDETNPVLLALQEQDTPEILGNHNEDISTTEGKVIFDLLFQARVPSTNELITLIINVEAQKDIHPKTKTGDTYSLLKRAVYYISRLISSQKGTIFTGSNYNKIKKVYSIWICMDSPDGNSAINRYQLKEQHLLHNYQEPTENYDLIGIVFIYLGKTAKPDRLMDLLQLLFKDRLTTHEKEEILDNDYNIDMNATGKEALDTMCNLSEGIYEDGRVEGRIEGRVEGRVEGRQEGEARLTKLLNTLITQGRSQDVTLALNDLSARQKFYQELHIE